MNRIEVCVGIIILFAGVVLLRFSNKNVRKGRDKWANHRASGKSLMEDLDEEQKEIDNLMR